MRIRTLFVCAVLARPTAATGDTARDVVTVGSVVVTEVDGTVRVPVYVLDAPGTPVGSDQPEGRRISAIAIKIAYGPDPCMDTVEPYFDISNGVLAGVPLQLHVVAGVPGTSQAFVAFRNERLGPIPFHATAPPGDLLGELVFARSGCGPGPSVLGIDEAGLASIDDTIESTVNGSLLGVDGSIALPGVAVPTRTATPTRTVTPTPKITPTPTVTPTRTITPTPTVTPTWDWSLGSPTPTVIIVGGGGTCSPPSSCAPRTATPTTTPTRAPIPVPALGGSRLALLAVLLAISGALLVRRL